MNLEVVIEIYYKSNMNLEVVINLYYKSNISLNMFYEIILQV